MSPAAGVRGRAGRRIRPAPAVVMTLLVALGGCYSNRPATLETLAPGQRVRVTVAPSWGEEITQLLGSSGRTLEGELAQIVGNAFYLSVPSGVRQEGFRFETLHQTIRLEQADVLVIERKQLDRGRTALVMGILATGLTAVLIDTFSGKTGGDTRQPPGEIPSDARVPGRFLRIP
jgi:hypothetical protein